MSRVTILFAVLIISTILIHLTDSARPTRKRAPPHGKASEVDDSSSDSEEPPRRPRERGHSSSGDRPDHHRRSHHRSRGRKHGHSKDENDHPSSGGSQTSERSIWLSVFFGCWIWYMLIDHTWTV